MGLTTDLTRVAELLASTAKALTELAQKYDQPVLIDGFDEAYYLNKNDDVAHAVATTKDLPDGIKSGYDHYIKFGKKEGRWPNAKGPTGLAPPPVPVPLPVPPTAPATTLPGFPSGKYEYDEHGLLTKPEPLKGPNNMRFDPVIEADCPTGIQVPSGKWLSKPRPDLKETLGGYIMRVWAQASGKEEGRYGWGALITGYASTQDCFYPGRPWDEAGTYWHEAADSYYNGRKLSEQETKDAAAAKATSDAQWAEHWAAKEAARKAASEAQPAIPAVRHERPATRPNPDEPVDVPVDVKIEGA